MRLVITLLMISILLIAGCTTNADVNSDDTCTDSVTCSAAREPAHVAENDPSKTVADKLEIYHFHGTKQCYSCKTVGAYAEETVNKYFKEELESGKIVFGHINVDLLENRELVEKYGATGSSLWLGAYKDGGFKAEENVNVWYKIGDKQAYLDYLKVLIEKRLAGEYS